ncbi:nuclear hormone receptor HR96-like isoform X2 [Mytilus californianus]|nr:nuclear hormone receptor HR96-like isoform X2 [Mytilus californianus]
MMSDNGDSLNSPPDIKPHLNCGQDDTSEDNSNAGEYTSPGSVKSETSPGKGRGRRAKDDKSCRVCGDKALGYNFNAVTCESCKAFFRRNALKDQTTKCLFQGNCFIDIRTRRFCPHCRLKKCFDIGMRKEMILDDNERKMRMAKVMHNRQKRKESVESLTTLIKTEPMDQEPDQSCQYATSTSGHCINSPSPDGMIDITSTVVTPAINIDALDIDKKLCRVLSKREAELCEHLTNGYASTMANYHCENLTSESYTDSNDLVNTSEQAVRRLIQFVKLIEDFKELSQEDQITGLKSCVLQSLMLRSVYFFDVEQEGWRTLTGLIPAKVLKDITGYSDLYETHTNFSREMKKTCKEDITVFAIIQSIIVFNPESVGLKNLQLVSDIQNRYIVLLKSYLEYKISFEYAQIYFPVFLRKIQELKKIGSDHAKIILQVQTSKIEPLMLEILNLS